MVAPAGALSCAIGPTHAILPSVITIAEARAAGLPVPSITVTLLRTVVSAPAGNAVTATANRAAAVAPNFRLRIYNSHLCVPRIAARGP